ncbi:MAG: ABC transporter substrate-binding protein [Thermomicrobiales bacterium]
MTRQTIDSDGRPFRTTSQGQTRRGLLKGAALGLGGSALGSLLPARRAAAQQATPAATLATPIPGLGATIVLPQNLRTDLAGDEIIVVLSPDGPAAPWEQVACDKFSQATGIIVTRQSGPIRAADRLVQYQSTFTLESRLLDVAMIDVTWIGRFAGHFFRLTKEIKSQGYPYFDRIVENNSLYVEIPSRQTPGKTVLRKDVAAIPWFGDAGLLYYRMDLLEKYGFSAPPTTWTDLEAMAQAIQSGERTSNPDFQGYVWQGGPYEGLTCDALEWQYAAGGGTIVDDEGKVQVNNPKTILAFERARNWVGTISPANVMDFDEEEARFIWQAGNAAFMRNWLYAYELGQAADSPIKDKFDIALVPKSDAGGTHRTGTLGGWEIMVPKYSHRKEAAIEFAKFITSRELQKSSAIELGRLPTIADLYDDPDVLSARPVFARLHDLFLDGVVARPSTVTASLYDNVSTAYATTVNQILSGSVDTTSAVAGLDDRLNQMLGDVPQVPIPTPTATLTPAPSPAATPATG